MKKEKRRIWLSAINRKNFDPPADACICSEHFVGGTRIVGPIQPLASITATTTIATTIMVVFSVLFRREKQ